MNSKRLYTTIVSNPLNASAYSSFLAVPKINTPSNWFESVFATDDRVLFVLDTAQEILRSLGSDRFSAQL
jgi:hypothetical protein